MDLALQPGHGRLDAPRAVRVGAGPVGELAVAAHADAGAGREVPDVAVARRRQVAVRVAIAVAAFAEIHAAAPAVVGRPQLLDHVGGVGAGRERVAVVADLGVDVEVVEQHELARQRVRVRRHLLAEDGQRRIAVALLEVAEDLIVGAVLADHVEHVLDRRGIADAARDRRRRRRAGRRQLLRVGVGRQLDDARGVRGEARRVRHVDDRQRALQQLPPAYWPSAVGLTAAGRAGWPARSGPCR